MWEYIVLGQIPGTHVRVSFAAWLAGCIVTACLLVVASMLRSDYTRRIIYLWQIRHIMQTAAYTQWLFNRRHIQA